MFPLPQQLSDAAKSQWESQLDIFHALSNKVFDSTDRIIALNLDTGKAALARSTETAQQLLATQDARDFLTYSTSQAQPAIESILAYSRQLFGIASSTQAELLAAAKARLDAGAPAAAPAAQPASAPVQVEAIVDVPAAAPAAAAASAPEPEPEPEPAAPAAAATLAPVAEPEPAAPAPLPLAATLPIAASAPVEIEADIKPVVQAAVKASPASKQNGPSTASKAVGKPASRGKRK